MKRVILVCVRVTLSRARTKKSPFCDNSHTRTLPLPARLSPLPNQQQRRRKRPERPIAGGGGQDSRALRDLRRRSEAVRHHGLPERQIPSDALYPGATFQRDRLRRGGRFKFEGYLPYPSISRTMSSATEEICDIWHIVSVPMLSYTPKSLPPGVIRLSTARTVSGKCMVGGSVVCPNFGRPVLGCTEAFFKLKAQCDSIRTVFSRST